MTNRIKELRTKQRLSLEKLGELAGTSRQHIHKLETGQVRLTVEWMMRLAPHLGVDPKEIMSLQAEDQSGTKSGALFRESPVHNLAATLPILGGARGNRQGVYHMPVEQDPIGRTPRPTQLEGVRTAYGLYVYDDSMAEKYCHGQTLWVHPEMPCRPGDGVVVIKHDDEAIVKILVRRTAKAVTLRQLNPPAEFDIDASAVRSIHRIIGSVDPL